MIDDLRRLQVLGQVVQRVRFTKPDVKRKEKLIVQVVREIANPPRKKRLDLDTESGSLTNRTSNELLHKRFPAVIRQLHVYALTHLKDHSSLFV